MSEIGKVQIQTDTGEVSVPVFQPGDSGSDIYEFLRVQTDSGTGFVPLTEVSGADLPSVRVHTQSHGTLAVTTSVSTSVLVESFEDDSTGGPTPAGWSTSLSSSDEKVVSGESVDGSRSYRLNNGTNNTIGHTRSAGVFTSAAVYSLDGSGYQPQTVTWSYNEQSFGQGGVGFWMLDSQGRISTATGTSNPNTVYSEGSGLIDVGGATGEYNRWSRYRMEIDWQNQTYTIFYGPAGSATEKVSQASFVDSASGVSSVAIGSFGSSMNGKFKCYIDDIKLL